VRTGTSWSREQKLTAGDGAAGDAFGSSVALTSDGSRALVAATHDDIGSNTNQGSAYVFVRSGTSWSHEQKLTASDGDMDDCFGSGVALTSDGSRALIGARVDEIGSNAAQGSAYVFVWTGTRWSQEQKLTADDGATGDYFGTSVALTSDGSRALVGAYGDDVGPNIDQGSVYAFVSGLTNGEPCTSAGRCFSGFCVDGVCCESACGGGATDDCQACSTDSGGSSNGTCTALVAAVAPMVTCRPAAGPCDVAETCRAGSRTCPPDGFRAAGTMCRARGTGACDVDDQCTGMSASCPDRVEPAGTVCRPSAGVCDQAETCDGTSPACPGDVFVIGRVCREATGECDVAETCDGTGPNCPADGFRPMGVECRPASCTDGRATGAARCTGSNAQCPDGVVSDCAPYVCGATSCRSECATSAECVEGFVCVAGRCERSSDGGTMMGGDGGVVDAGMGDGGAPVPGDAGGGDAMGVDGGGPRFGTKISGCACRGPERTSDARYTLASMLVGSMALGGRRRRRRR
ncbi:MAG: hypothetical protein RMK74_06155, partial [Myxococcales bacterium]|nr:hypothetical protein [Myxococcales bacterium]